MGTEQLIKFVITKQIEELPNALDVFCKPQGFDREAASKATGNIVISHADLLAPELAVLSFVLKDLFLLMQQSGLNNAQRQVWGAIAKTHQISVSRLDAYTELKLEDSSTGTNMILRLVESLSLKALQDSTRKPLSKTVALMFFATTYDEGVLGLVETKTAADKYAAEIHKGCSLDLFEYRQIDNSSYEFKLLSPAMPRQQQAVVKLG